MKRFGRRCWWALVSLACAAVVLAALVGSGGIDDLIARLLLKPGHILSSNDPTPLTRGCFHITWSCAPGANSAPS